MSCSTPCLKFVLSIHNKLITTIDNIDEYFDNIFNKNKNKNKNKIVELEEIVIDTQPDLIYLNDYILL